MDLNDLHITGRLGADPTTHYTPDGKAVTSFSLAVEAYKGNTQWFRVSAWGKTGEACAQYLTKGRQVYVAGEVKGRLFDDRSGKARISMDVQASKVVFLANAPRQDQVEDQVEDEGYDDDEEIPF